MDDKMAKKELKIRVRHNTPHKEIYYESGGQVPEMLKGMYTDDRVAKNAIATYLDKRDNGNSTASPV
jgi:hypothetical protein